MARITRHLSYANVTASLALFVALGGISWAAVALPQQRRREAAKEERGYRAEDQGQRGHLGQGQGRFAAAG